MLDTNAAVAAADTARTAMIVAQKRADSATALAAQLRRAADRAEAGRDSALARATVAQGAADRLTKAFATAAAAAPDTCRPLVLAADSALLAKDGVITDLHTALQASQEAGSHLRAALDTSTAAIARLRASGSDLIDASGSLIHSERRPFWLRVLPKPGVGLALGLSTEGKPALVVGISLNWPL